MSAVTVVCFGLVTIDHMMRVDRVPLPNEKIVASDSTIETGGPASNAAVAASVLGSEARFVTIVGDSPLTQYARTSIVRHGVEFIDLAHSAKGSPAVSTVLLTVSTGERAVVSTNALAAPDLVGVQPELLDGASLLLVDGHHMQAATKLAKLAQQKGIAVLFDGGSWKRGTEELLRYVDCAVVSENFVVPDVPPAQVLEHLRDLGCEAAAQSRGEKPIRYLDSHGACEIPVSVIDAIDTLGAGDVLHGAIAHYAAHAEAGKRWLESLLPAARIATESCRYPGAHGWIGSLHQNERA